MSLWNLDKSHSAVGFKIKHLMISTVRGEFTDFEGSIESADDTFENASVKFSAHSSSVNTHNEMRDNHLKAADVFNASEFPTLSFVSHSFVKKGDAFEVAGDLTMRGITKPVTLSAMHGGIGTGMDGKRVVGFEISGAINRKDFGVGEKMPSAALSEDVTLDIQIEAKEA